MHSRVQNTEDALKEVPKWVHLKAVSQKHSVVGREEGMGSQGVSGRITGSDGESEKKCFCKYPRSKIILHHNDKFRKLGEPCEYLSDDMSFSLNTHHYMELMPPVYSSPCFKDLGAEAGGRRGGRGWFYVLNCFSMNC